MNTKSTPATDEAVDSSLWREVMELRAWCKKEALAMKRDGQARSHFDCNRHRCFGQMDALNWVIQEIDIRTARHAKLP